MGQLNVPQIEWIREYLAEQFPDQPLPERAHGIDTIVIELKDSKGYPKELRVSREFLLRHTKAVIREYLNNAKIAEQLEAVPTSVSISDVL